MHENEPQRPTPEPHQAVAELRALVARARHGDHDAMPRVREIFDAHPGVWRHAGDLARVAEGAWVRLAAGPDPALAEALRRKVAEIRGELSGPDPTAAEALLVERVCVAWLAAAYGDAAAAALPPDASLRQAEFAQKRQGRAQRQFLEALGALVSARRLLARSEPPAAASRSPRTNPGGTPVPPGGGVETGPAPPPAPGDDGAGPPGGGAPASVPYDPSRVDPGARGRPLRPRQ